ncbi:hypothetical protein JYU34_017483 [Plutella xylostella]|uniref:Uncharacterized protein n=1 Tax=Plutella xylostella TaxID=51655 RepID=A0ABQ7Q1A3_PLUXY|nr:hypothetical protein JYU34_017483 [Plutella xylostella]
MFKQLGGAAQYVSFANADSTRGAPAPPPRVPPAPLLTPARPAPAPRSQYISGACARRLIVPLPDTNQNVNGYTMVSAPSNNDVSIRHINWLDTRYLFQTFCASAR